MSSAKTLPKLMPANASSTTRCQQANEFLPLKGILFHVIKRLPEWNAKRGCVPAATAM
jgi:hypothetical protein